MEQEERAYRNALENISNAVKSQMFGKPCYKIRGKAFVCFFENEMVFKLSGEAHQDALSLDGAQLFDPSKKGRPMKAWVQLPYHHHKQWEFFALKAVTFVLANL
jgi:hypothetical protein